MVMEVVQEDVGDGNMQCADHPYKNSTPGGICAFCLQEKLGKLVSSSFPVAIFPSSSTSSTPSFRSDFGGTTTNTTNTTTTSTATTTSSALTLHPTRRSSRLPFLLAQRRKKKKDNNGVMMNGSDSARSSIVFKRSKSTTVPRHGMHFADAEEDYNSSPHKRGFWSFLYSSSSSKHSSTNKKSERPSKDSSFASSSSSASSSIAASSSVKSREKKREEFIVIEENDDQSPDQAAFDRKVSRSRSVGCGSRSFSGDFFERISTGFGDCTLRRVESQREGKPKHGVRRNGAQNGQDYIKERVKCGGIFSGFMVTSSNSSSSSSSSYWLSSSTDQDHNNNVNGNGIKKVPSTVGYLAHGRTRSWGWAFASPMRAFSSSKPSSTGKRGAHNKNAAPNLAAVPSLLAVRS